MQSLVKNVMQVPEVIRLQDVTFTYPDEATPTLERFSLSVKTGEKWLVSGPSGCGKSTLFYLLNGLYPEACDGIVSGEWSLFGKPYSAYKPGEVSHYVATVFQDPDSQFCMPTVEEELAFTLENRNVPREEMTTRITQVLAETGLTEFRHRVIQTLSGGEKQRIATACALIMEPQILLLDEPLAHLDPMTAKEYVEWFDRLQKKYNWTVLAIDHQKQGWGSFFDHEYCMEELGEFQNPMSYRNKQIAHEFVFDANVQVEDILHEAHLTLRGGEITVLAGPNGSGKTTLLKALAGLIPYTGSRSHDTVGYVPQSPEFLFLSPSVKQEVALGGGSQTTYYLEQLNLQHVAHSNPFAISQGQKRRTAVAAMLNDGRSILLLDEPTAGQDARSLARLEEALHLVAEQGTALLVVTHDMSFASRIANQLVLMKDGRLSKPVETAVAFSSPELLAAYRLIAPTGGEAYAKLAPSYESVR